MRTSYFVCFVVAMSTVIPATTSATTPIVRVADPEPGRATRVGLETPGVLRLSNSDAGLGTVSVSCVDVGDPRPEVRLVRPSDPAPGRQERASMDIYDVLVPEVFDDETDGDIISREAVRVWDYRSSPEAPPGRYDLRLKMTIYSVDESGADFQLVGGADYQIDITCTADPT